MFQGTTPAPVLQIIGNIVKQWEVKDLYVGCSGNFTIERAISQTLGVNTYGSDVSTYTCVLGNYFSGKDTNLKIRENYDGQFTFLEKYINAPEEKVATILLLSSMTLYMNSKANAYYTKMINAYIK